MNLTFEAYCRQRRREFTRQEARHDAAHGTLPGETRTPAQRVAEVYPDRVFVENYLALCRDARSDGRLGPLAAASEQKLLARVRR